MMVMTAKVDMKKIALGLAAVVALVICLILLLGGGEPTENTAAPAPSSNDGRVKFLSDFGWDVTSSPTESSQVKIPAESSPVFDRYNALQKKQGYDLSKFAGKNVMRYVYQLNNFPGATGPVYATLLVYKDAVIGGDVTDTSVGGRIRGFKMPEASKPTSPTTGSAPAPTAPADGSTPAPAVTEPQQAPSPVPNPVTNLLPNSASDQASDSSSNPASNPVQ